MKKLLFIIIMLFAVSVMAQPEPREQAIELEWNHPGGPGITGFRLYMNTSPDVQAVVENKVFDFPYAGEPITVHDGDYTLEVPVGQPVTYYFVMTAVAGDLESDKSNEVFKQIFYPVAPNIIRIQLKVVN